MSLSPRIKEGPPISRGRSTVPVFLPTRVLVSPMVSDLDLELRQVNVKSFMEFTKFLRNFSQSLHSILFFRSVFQQQEFMREDQSASMVSSRQSGYFKVTATQPRISPKVEAELGFINICQSMKLHEWLPILVNPCARPCFPLLTRRILTNRSVVSSDVFEHF